MLPEKPVKPEKAESERDDGEKERRASQKRTVKRGGRVVARRFLHCCRGIIKGRAVMVLRVVSVHTGFKETSGGERLICFVWMECAVEY